MLVLYILLGTVGLTALSMVFALRSVLNFSGSRSAAAEDKTVLTSDLFEWGRNSKAFMSQTCLFLAPLSFVVAVSFLACGSVGQYSLHSHPIVFLSCVGYWIAVAAATLIVGLRIY
jgi:hypothetical protein